MIFGPRLLKIQIATFCIVILTACTGPRSLGLQTNGVIDADASLENILVSTTRKPEGASFGGERSFVTRYGSYKISIPSNHRRGQIEWGGDSPDPKKHFVTQSRRSLEGSAAFAGVVNDIIAETPDSNREAIVFVHGYNTDFTEGVFRLAQMRHDLRLPPVTVQYSWPSAGRLRDYARDRDSALFARDGLEETLLVLAASDVERIVVVGHSMGALLVVEMLRQMGRKSQSGLRPKLASVVLISPDIDLELFRAQVRDAGPLPQPFFVFTSRADNALKLSSLLTGKPRLGSLARTESVEDLDIVFVDVSNVEGAGSDHLVPATSELVLDLIKTLPRVVGALTDDDNRLFGPFRRGINRVTASGNVVFSDDR